MIQIEIEFRNPEQQTNSDVQNRDSGVGKVSDGPMQCSDHSESHLEGRFGERAPFGHLESPRGAEC